MNNTLYTVYSDALDRLWTW